MGLSFSPLREIKNSATKTGTSGIIALTPPNEKKAIWPDNANIQWKHGFGKVLKIYF